MEIIATAYHAASDDTVSVVSIEDEWALILTDDGTDKIHFRDLSKVTATDAARTAYRAMTTEHGPEWAEQAVLRLTGSQEWHDVLKAQTAA